MKKNINLIGDEKILIFPPFGMGDTLMFLPVAYFIKKFFPDTKIHIMCSQSVHEQEIIEFCPYVDEIKLFPLKRYSIFQVPMFLIKDCPGFIKNIKKEKYDYVLSVNLNFLRKVLIRLTGVKLLSQSDFSSNQTANNLSLLKYLGINHSDGWGALLKFPPPLEEEILKKFDLEAGKYICFNWLGKNPGRSYLAMPEVIDEFACNFSKVLIGKSHDYSSFNFKNQTGIVDLINRTNLVELAVIIKNSFGVATIDGGVMHLALALNKKTLGLFGNVTSEFLVPPNSQLDFKAIDSRDKSEIKNTKEEFKKNQDYLNKIDPNKVLQKLKLFFYHQ